MVLLNARGEPLELAPHKKAPPVPKPKDSGPFGQWAGRDLTYLSLPGGAVMQFDLNRLSLADYRSMRQHYQLGSSLNVLSFIMHQIEWSISCKNTEIKNFIEEEIRNNWTPLIHAISQAFWAGYSPIAVNYENRDGFTRIQRFKDLVPEECMINWKKVKGWAPSGHTKPTMFEYDGLMQNGFLIPTENTLWYPLLMENGDHYGRKLLKSAFPSWFFSNLIHLFANRYFERFGEPLPVGRAPFDDQLDQGDGTTISGKRAMENIVGGIRSRAVTVLPSGRDPMTKEYDYDIDYLESQMRGADFERYLSRLDEEMSLAVFTPVLLFRTADVGSYNLGQAHLRIFQQMLNSISGDIQFYIQNYLVNRIKEVNFPGNKDVCTWEYRNQGNGEMDMFKEILIEVIRQGQGGVDLVELGRIAGLTLHEIEQIVEPPTPPGAGDDPKQSATLKPKPKAKAVLKEAISRVARETGGGKVPTTLGFRNRFVEALVRDGMSEPDAQEYSDQVYSKMNNFIIVAAADIGTADEMQAALQILIDFEVPE